MVYSLNKITQSNNFLKLSEKSKETGGVKQQKIYFVKEKMTKIQDYRFLNCKVDTCEK